MAPQEKRRYVIVYEDGSKGYIDTHKSLRELQKELTHG